MNTISVETKHFPIFIDVIGNTESRSVDTYKKLSSVLNSIVSGFQENKEKESFSVEIDDSCLSLIKDSAQDMKNVGYEFPEDFCVELFV